MRNLVSSCSKGVRSSLRVGWVLAGLMLAAGRAVAASPAVPEEALLRPSNENDSLARVEVLFEADGDLKVVEEGRQVTLPMKVVGTLGYDEKRISKLETGAVRGWRHYDVARATISIRGRETRPVLREGYQLMAVDVGEGEAEISAPAGPLTAEELDLVTVPGNTLVVEQLLPSEPVSPGSSWQQTDTVWANLLGLDAVSSNDVQLKLVELTADAAKIHLAGLVYGAVDGVATELEIKGKIKFDRAAGRITWLALLVKEVHGIGHTVPGLEALARVQVKITPTNQSKALDEATLAELADYWDQPQLELVYQPDQKPVHFQYDRRWHVIHEDLNGAVLRFVDRGELVAQANVTAMAPLAAGQTTSLSQFQEDIKAVLKEKFGQFVQATELKSNSGGTLHRVIVAGVVADLPIQWNYYLISDAAGRQAAVVVTLEQQLAERLGQADQAIVDTLRLADRAVDKAARAESDPRR